MTTARHFLLTLSNHELPGFHAAYVRLHEATLKHGGNVTQIAGELDLPRSSLVRFLAKHAHFDRMVRAVRLVVQGKGPPVDLDAVLAQHAEPARPTPEYDSPDEQARRIKEAGLRQAESARLATIARLHGK
jgi:hypothetical protein